MPLVAAIIVAAGRGTRARPHALPKQYRSLAGRPLVAHSLEATLRHPAIAKVLCVIHPDDQAIYDEIARALDHDGKLLPAGFGGATRQASVHAGLEALAGHMGRAPDIVLVHDAARPFLSPQLIDRAIAAAELYGAAVPGLSVTDTVKVVGADGCVAETPDRAMLRTVQTPQAFAFPALLAAHRAAAERGIDGFTDDGAIAEWAGGTVHIFPGEARNVKLTTGEDFVEAERRLSAQRDMTVRFGIGYDVHTFGEGDHIMIGGIAIAHERGIVAHSDGDVVLHALTDALLGAIADGDIGTHFPPSDPQWKGASSDLFLRDAGERVRRRGGIIDNVDVIVVCERPRIGPHREAIRARIAEILAIGAGQVSVKATTSEGLGFTGRREGIAAQASATVRVPASAEGQA